MDGPHKTARHLVLSNVAYRAQASSEFDHSVSDMNGNLRGILSLVNPAAESTSALTIDCVCFRGAVPCNPPGPSLSPQFSYYDEKVFMLDENDSTIARVDEKQLCKAK